VCGIVGAVAKRNVVPILIEGLKRLEYRGYDSAGVAVMNGKAGHVRCNASARPGASPSWRSSAGAQGLAGEVGIAHTRWRRTACPRRRTRTRTVRRRVGGAQRHHRKPRGDAQAPAREGYEFVSDTDTEVIAAFGALEPSVGAKLFDAVKKSVVELVGAYAIAVVRRIRPLSAWWVARHGAPLLLGLGNGENFAASTPRPSSR